MKLLLGIFAGLAVVGLAFWIVAYARVPENSPAMFASLAFFAIPPLGSLWMLYLCIRYEKHPFPMMLLAFLPFTFIWYYFERVRPGKTGARSVTGRSFQ